MTRDLRDYTLIRQNELTRTLAGCAITEPGLVVELVRKLRPADLTDVFARKFLLALKADSDPVQVALELGLAREYPRWMGIACDALPDLKQAAEAATDEIKRLCVMRQALTELQGWLEEARRMGGYKYA